MKHVEKEYLRVLKKILGRLHGSDIPWAITGSLGFALQGVPVKPHDIDVQTDREGAYEIERLLSEFVIERVHFVSAERIRSHLGVLSVDGIKVEIMGGIEKRNAAGEWQPVDDLRRYIRVAVVENVKIPVLSLQYEYEAYMQLGRNDRAELLRDWLEHHDGLADEVLSD